MDGNPDPRHGFTVGPEALIAACLQAEARQEKAAREALERASRYLQPRPIGLDVLAHTIPPHVDALLARSAWDHAVPEGTDRNQKPLYLRTRQVALSLVVRGFDAEEFLAEMPGYTPSTPFKFCRGKWGTRPGQNVLWWDLCTRRGKLRDPGHLVTEAFLWAGKQVGTGFLLDIDQPDYIEALTERWRWRVQEGAVKLTKGERAVLDWVMAQMLARGWLDVTCASREVAKATGLTQRGALKILKQLDARGILICRNPGVGDKRIRKAAIYCLSPQLEQTSAPTHSKSPSSWGALRAPRQDAVGRTKRPENQDLASGNPHCKTNKTAGQGPFPSPVQQELVLLSKNNSSTPNTLTSRGPWIGELTPPSHRGMSPPGGRGGDIPDHLAGLTVLARVVDQRQKFVAELESLMGNPAPQPTPENTLAQQAAIWRIGLDSSPRWRRQ
jgi:hypothetical protein